MIASIHFVCYIPEELISDNVTLAEQLATANFKIKWLKDEQRRRHKIAVETVQEAQRDIQCLHEQVQTLKRPAAKNAASRPARRRKAKHAASEAVPKPKKKLRRGL
jgi:endonuclease/exonuclease/phosphatase family metal-dependent hydrolase